MIPNVSWQNAPFVPLTNPDEIAKFAGGVGGHEFYHDSGGVHRRYYKIDAGNPIPPGQEGANHYNYTLRPSPTVPALESRMVMMTNGTYTDIHMGRHGMRLWTEYDEKHLQHQYMVP
jgi:hypothetical protein